MKKSTILFWAVVAVLTGVLVGMSLGLFPAIEARLSIRAVGRILAAAFVLRWLRFFLHRHSRKK